MQHMELLEVTWLKCWLKKLFSLFSLRSFLFSKYQYTRLVLIKISKFVSFALIIENVRTFSWCAVGLPFKD